MQHLHLKLPRTELTCRAVLFDLDGVLVDSLQLIERHLREWAQDHDLDPRPVIAASPGRTNTELVAEVAPHLDATYEAGALLTREINDIDGLTACAGASLVLQSIPDDMWAVVTSGHRPVALGRTRAASLPIPSTLVTADDVCKGKPDPEGYLRAARCLNIDPADCVVIEDAPAGLRAAAAAGMRAIAIADGQGGPVGEHEHRLDSLAELEVAVHPMATRRL